MSSNPISRQLSQLLQLQTLDNEIMDFEVEREKIPEQLGNLEGSLIEKRKAYDDFESQIQILEEDRSEKKRALDLELIKLKNTRNKEMTLQNIKQYEAYVKEVETQEVSSDEMEESLKHIEKRVNEFKAEMKTIKVSIDEMTSEQTKERGELEGRVVSLDQALEEMYDRRDDLAEELQEGIYLKYEYIAERKDGIGVAEVRHGHCQVCNMAIPPQMYNELIRGDKLMACPACQRILVYCEDEVEG